MCPAAASPRSQPIQDGKDTVRLSRTLSSPSRQVHGQYCKEGKYSRTWISSLILAGYALSEIVLAFAWKGALREGTEFTHRMLRWNLNSPSMFFLHRKLISVFTLIQPKTKKICHLLFSTDLYWAAQLNSWKLWKWDQLLLSHRYIWIDIKSKWEMLERAKAEHDHARNEIWKYTF